MTITECIFLAAGFIFCVLMLAGMGFVQWHLSEKTPFATLPVRLILGSKKSDSSFQRRQ